MWRQGAQDIPVSFCRNHFVPVYKYPRRSQVITSAMLILHICTRLPVREEAWCCLTFDSNKWFINRIERSDRWWGLAWPWQMPSRNWACFHLIWPCQRSLARAHAPKNISDYVFILIPFVCTEVLRLLVPTDALELWSNARPVCRSQNINAAKTTRLLRHNVLLCWLGCNFERRFQVFSLFWGK